MRLQRLGSVADVDAGEHRGPVCSVASPVSTVIAGGQFAHHTASTLGGRAIPRCNATSAKPARQLTMIVLIRKWLQLFVLFLTKKCISTWMDIKFISYFSCERFAESFF